MLTTPAAVHKTAATTRALGDSVKEHNIMLDERMWQKWIQKNNAHDRVLVKRVRAGISIMVVLALFLALSTLWELTK
jgi:hypothetical protein